MEEKSRIENRGRGTRQANIELCRIIAVLGVIILHIVSPFGGATSVVDKGCVNYYLMYGFESLFICAVDLFLIISGYFLCQTNRRSIRKPLMLLIQTSIFSCAAYVINCLMRRDAFTWLLLLKSLIPAKYFVILYSVVYVLSPYMNYVFNGISVKQKRMLLSLCIALFVIWPSLTDILAFCTGNNLDEISTIGLFGSQCGYTVVNFAVMYLIGAYLRQVGCRFRNWSAAGISLSILGVTGIIMMYAVKNSWYALAYYHPLVVLNAVLVFELFLKLKIGERLSSMVNYTAKGVFSVYLFHEFLVPLVFNMDSVNWSPFELTAHILKAAVLMFAMCILAHWLYHIIVVPMLNGILRHVPIPEIDLNKE